MRTTIIIPAGGKGERLNLPIAKELLPIAQGKVSIDFIFESLKPIVTIIKVVVVISRLKLETVRYLEKYSNEFDIAFVFQKSSMPGFVGAIRSAVTLFSNKVLILLPDQIIVPFLEIPNPYEKVLTYLDKNPVCFIAALENNIENFYDEGALTLENIGEEKLVTQYIEKPLIPSRNLNAVWAAIGFNSNLTEEVLTTMENNFNKTLTIDDFIKSPFYKAPAVLIKKCIDLGTWKRYTKWIAEGNL